MDMDHILKGSQLTTLHIFYRLPDHPELLQSFSWQMYDIPPDFPEVLKFLEFWSRSIDGRLHSVQIAVADHFILPSSRIASFYGELG